MSQKVRQLQRRLKQKGEQMQRLKSQTLAFKNRCGDHPEKIASLLKSIDLLKLENANLKKLQKEHKRSQLINNLNREIDDQDLVIQTLQKIIRENMGQEQGQVLMDKEVVKQLTKGPARVRALTRYQLKLEIKKLSNQILLMRKKKGGGQIQQLRRTQQNMSVASEQVSQTNELNQQVSQQQELRLNLQQQEVQIQNLNDQIRKLNRSIDFLKSVQSQRDYFKLKFQDQLEAEKRRRLERQQQIERRLGGVLASVLGIDWSQKDEVQQLITNYETLNQEKANLQEQNQRLLLQNNNERLKVSSLSREIQSLRDKTSDADSKRTARLRELQEERLALTTQLEKRIKASAQLDRQVSIYKRENEGLNRQLKASQQKFSSLTKQQAQRQNNQIKSLKQQVEKLKSIKLGDKSAQTEYWTQKIKDMEQRYQELFSTYRKLRDQAKSKGIEVSEEKGPAINDDLMSVLLKLQQENANLKTKGKVSVPQTVFLTQKQKKRLEETDSDISELGLLKPSAQQMASQISDFEYEVKIKEGGVLINNVQKKMIDDMNSSISEIPGIPPADEDQESLYSVKTKQLVEKGLNKALFTKKQIQQQNIPMRAAHKVKVKATTITDLQGQLGKLSAKMKNGRPLRVTHYDMQKMAEVDSQISDIYSGEYQKKEDSNLELIVQRRKAALSELNSDLQDVSVGWKDQSWQEEQLQRERVEQESSDISSVLSRKKI